MALVESNLQVRNSELTSKEGSPRFRKKNKLKTAVTSVATVIALGTSGGLVFMSEGFTSQTAIAKPMSTSEVSTLKRELTEMLTREKLLGDPQNPLPVEVITFNTASGNPAIKTPQREFVDLPFYQKIINGTPDAPILGLQEAGPAQVKELAKHKDEGDYSYTYIKAESSRGGDLLLIPKRFEVLKSKSERYSMPGQIKGVLNALPDDDFDPSQVMPRMYNEMKLKDRLSGTIFTVVNTHLSYVKDIQATQADELFAIIQKAEKEGPVILMGDLNDNNNLPTDVGRLTGRIKKSELSDMGPSTPPEHKTNIDYILTKGFDSMKKEYLYYANKSDHYPEADWIQMDK